MHYWILMAMLGWGFGTIPASAISLPNTRMPISGQAKWFQLSDWKGHVVLVDFWATWCPPCRSTMPHLTDLQQRFGPQGFKVLGVALDHGGDQTVRPFLSKNPVNYLVTLDDGSLADQLGVKFLPTAFLVDRQGKVVKRYTGVTSPETLAKDIQAALEAPRAAAVP